MSKIGVRNFHYSKQTTEDSSDSPAVYGTPVAVPGLVSVEVTPESNTATLYADDGPYETAASMGNVALSLNLADIDLSVQADLLGHTYDSSTKTLTKKTTDTAPYVAVMFSFTLANGGTRCVKLFKGKFALPTESGTTKGENVEFQTSDISASFVQLKNNASWELVQDFAAGESTDTFFASVL